MIWLRFIANEDQALPCFLMTHDSIETQLQSFNVETQLQSFNIVETPDVTELRGAGAVVLFQVCGYAGQDMAWVNPPAGTTPSTTPPAHPPPHPPSTTLPSTTTPAHRYTRGKAAVALIDPLVRLWWQVPGA